MTPALMATIPKKPEIPKLGIKILSNEEQYSNDNQRNCN
jgi:hypothetical protein